MLTLHYSPGACSLGPHIVIEELGLTCQYRRVTLAKREQSTAEYRAINPRMRVPALVLDDGVLTEGTAIATYLASLQPNTGLLARPGSLEFGKCLEWLAWMASTLHVSYAQVWCPERFLPGTSDGRVLAQQGRVNIIRQNEEVEQQLNSSWFLGDAYSIADCYLLAFYRWGIRIGLPMEASYPRWTAWRKRMLERPAVQRVVEREGIGATWLPA
jgi:glutathione S-transferase